MAKSQNNPRTMSQDRLRAELDQQAQHTQLGMGMYLDESRHRELMETLVAVQQSLSRAKADRLLKELVLLRRAVEALALCSAASTSGVRPILREWAGMAERRLKDGE